MAVGAFTLLLCFSSLRAGKLTDITKPYLGEYECISARLGERDCLDGFQNVTMELNGDGTFTLHCKELCGNCRKIGGEYSYDEKKESITFTIKGEREIKREFPLKNGILTVCFQMGEKTAVFQFEQK